MTLRFGYFVAVALTSGMFFVVFHAILSIGQPELGRGRGDDTTVQKSDRRISLWSSSDKGLNFSRSLDELLKLFTEAQSRKYEEFAEDPLVAMARSLTEIELVTLTKYLLEADQARYWRMTAAVVERCGEVDSSGTGAFLRRMIDLRLAQELAEDPESRDARLELSSVSAFYRGWAKADPKAAWRGIVEKDLWLQDEEQGGLRGSEFGKSFADVLTRLAENEPEFALNLLFENDEKLTPTLSLASTILEALPRDSDWRVISQRVAFEILLPSKFMSHYPENTLIVLFSRLAEADMTYARDWFREVDLEIQKREEFADSWVPSTLKEEDLVARWYFDSPSAGDRWLKKMVEEGREDELVAMFRPREYGDILVSQKHLNVWRFIPNQEERNDILLRAIEAFKKPEPHSYGRGTSRTFLHRDLDLSSIEEILPDYNLSATQEREILKILREVKASE